MKWLRASLQAKVFVAHLLVILVGVSTLFIATDLLAPNFFDRLIFSMMGPGAAGGMGQMMSATMNAAVSRAFRQAMTEAHLLAAAAATVAAVIISFIISDRITTPARRMVAASKRIATGRYSERVPVGDPDELGQLATSFNDMAASLEATERRRLELVGDVAHELRTPLATIAGYLEGLLDGVVEPSEQTWAKLHDETSRLRRLVDDLQELSRAEARQISLAIAPVSPATIVKASLERLQPQFTEKGLTLQVTIEDHLPNVLADHDRAIQVLTNILSNAIRYTPAPGEVGLAVRPQGNAVLFEVSDTGVGLAPEHLPQVFERFYRVDKSRSRTAGGSGIGLTIAKVLVEAMSGRIWAASAGLGKGATFSFTLPTTHP